MKERMRSRLRTQARSSASVDRTVGQLALAHSAHGGILATQRNLVDVYFLRTASSFGSG